VKPLTFMLIAGDASGDVLGAELIAALRQRTSDAKFFGAGGTKMQAAGLELLDDFTANPVFGFDAVWRALEFRARFKCLLQAAVERKPDALVCVDFAGFNRRFAHAVREQSCASGNWKPKIIQYVSPQVWASRPSRADKMAKDLDLLLAIFPFEKAWYAQRTPHLCVEFVGHPMIDRYAGQLPTGEKTFNTESPLIVLLPGSRPKELTQHLPVLRAAMQRIREAKPDARAVMVLSEQMAAVAREIGLPANVELQSNLAATLARADLALAKSGTVTLECGVFGVPTVVFYKASPLTYAIGSRIVTVKWLAMPNLLANEEVFPEFVQDAATPENISRAALELMTDGPRRSKVQAKLGEIRASLGTPAASGRAAQAIIELLGRQ
jgi:lipid-A-disaccharide synthase